MSIPKNSKRDWDVVTGWEKRIAVDFGSIGPSHVRWSHWTYKERDIVARKVHEIELINQAHGNKSKRADDWRKENTPIVVDFVRDGKTMPDWAHAEYRESGVPEHVEVIWKREKPGDPASKGDWAYNPPGPWEKGEEPPWSAKIKDPEYTGYMDKKYGGVLSYTENKETGDRFDTSGNLISTRESRAKEDVPNWRKHELGRLEDVDGHIVPGPNALPKDFEQYGDNIVKTKRNPLDDANRYRKAVGLPPLKESQSDKLRAALLKVNARPDVVVKEFNPETGTLDEIQGSANTMTPKKIMPGDSSHTALEKAQNWAAETHHGKAHQNRWNRVAATMGADNGADPYTFDEVKKIWQQFGKNARWTVAVDWFETDDEDVAGMVEYHLAPAMQGNYTAADFEKMWNQKPVIVQVKGWSKAIIDPKVGVPTYWLDGDGEATETWERVGDDWQKVGDIVKAKVSIGEHITGVWKGGITNADGTPIKYSNTDPVVSKTENTDQDTNKLDESVIAKLPEYTEFDAQEFYEDNAGDSISWVAQREPSVGPHVVSVLFHDGRPVGKKASRFAEFKDLPFWTRAQAENYFLEVVKVGSYSRRSLDGHWNTVKGYCDIDKVTPIALAATQLMEEVEKNLNKAIRANDWGEVARLAKWQETTIKEARENG